MGGCFSSDQPVASLEVVGVDQPGIVKGLIGLLRASGVNLLEFAEEMGVEIELELDTEED